MLGSPSPHPPGRPPGSSATAHGRRRPCNAQVARSVVGSSLAKSAIFGHDPNWGRLAAAAGYSGVAFDQRELGVQLGSMQLMRGGQPLAFDKVAANKYLKVGAAVCGHARVRGARAWGRVRACGWRKAGGGCARAGSACRTCAVVRAWLGPWLLRPCTTRPRPTPARAPAGHVRRARHCLRQGHGGLGARGRLCLGVSAEGGAGGARGERQRLRAVCARMCVATTLARQGAGCPH